MNDWRRGHNTVSLPELRKADVAVCLATVLARCSQLGDPLLDYPSREAASAMGVGQLEFCRIMELQGQMRMLRDWPALKSHVEEWKHTAGSGTPLGFILAMEGADPILSRDRLNSGAGAGCEWLNPFTTA